MKPLTLQVQETEKEIAEVINKANLPAYVLKQILKDIYQQIEVIEQQEIEEYQKKESEE